MSKPTLNTIYNENCLNTMARMPDEFVDSIVTDPPYGLSFMGKKWDYEVPSVDIWKECLRVLKPGGYLLSFAGTRTQHRMACNIEDAGFEIRDMIAWVYGQGFPKSLNIGIAVDKLQGNEREVVGISAGVGGENLNKLARENGNDDGNAKSCGAYGKGAKQTPIEINITRGTSKWEGWGTALKPALEPITVARKPLSENTVAKNVLKWGCGGINIDVSRVKTNNFIGRDSTEYEKQSEGWGLNSINKQSNSLGRFPANFIHDGSDEVVSLFPNTKSGGGNKANIQPKNRDSQVPSTINGGAWTVNEGSAARFFYCAKASKAERNRGCEELGKKIGGGMKGTEDKTLLTGSGNIRNNLMKNNHATVKPIALMQYLIKLVTPENGIVLDPFMGSGTTGIACVVDNFNFIGCELSKEYCDIARERINNELAQFKLFEGLK